MTNTDRMVDWLRKAMDAAQAAAEGARELEFCKDGRWIAKGPFGNSLGLIQSESSEDIIGNSGEDIPWEYTAHIARHSPTSVLRRIAADRKTLDDCDDVLHDFVFGAFRQLAYDTVRNLAEGYGWTEETTA